MDVETQNVAPPTGYRVYARRWLMMSLFVGYCIANSFQWLQYSIIEDIIIKYYNVNSGWVQATSVVYMVTYVICIFPAMVFLERMGLKWSILLGSLGTAIGAWIKFCTVKRTMFIGAFVGQTIVAFCQIFTLCLPPRVAAVWFGSNELSTACAFGVTGNNIGTAMAFYIPPIVVKDHDNMDDVRSELIMLFLGTAAFSTVVCVVTVCLLQEKPPSLPSRQQEQQRQQQQEIPSTSMRNVFVIVWKLFYNRGYMMVLAAFSLNQGVQCAFSTLMNEMILTYYERDDDLAGLVGLINVVAGIPGSYVLSLWQDRSGNFKLNTLIIYAMSLLGMVAFTFALDCKDITLIYATSSLLGFFLGGYTPLALDMGAEVTYPDPEGVTGGFMNLPAQLAGIAITYGGAALMRVMGPFWVNIMLCGALVLGTLIHLLVKPEYRRRNAGRTENTEEQDTSMRSLHRPTSETAMASDTNVVSRIVSSPEKTLDLSSSTEPEDKNVESQDTPTSEEPEGPPLSEIDTTKERTVECSENVGNEDVEIL